MGPFNTPLMHNLHISHIGDIPKADGDLRMITNLSHTPSISVNPNIDIIYYTTVKYASFDWIFKQLAL